MHEENLLDLSQMSWISPALCTNWQTLNTCIMEGEQIEAATVLNILNGILSAVIQSAYEVEKLHLEPEDAASLGRTMDCLTRLYLSYHRQYIREQNDDQPLSSDQIRLQKLAKEADLYGEFLAYLKSAPQVWRLRQMEAEIQQLKTALEGCQEENNRLLELSNQSALAQDLEAKLQIAQAAQVVLNEEHEQLKKTLETRDEQLTALLADLETAAAEKDTLEDTIQLLQTQLASARQSDDSNAKINLEAYIETLKAELEAQQAAAQAAAQLASERIAKLEAELEAARQAPAAGTGFLPNPETDPVPILNPEVDPEPTPVPQPDSDTFHPDTVTGGICTVETCGGKTKLGTPLPAIRDQIEYLDLTLCDANEIADEAFRGCANLKQVVLPLSMIIGAASFADCPKLEEVYLEYAPRIGDRAFHSCISLQKVHFTSRRTEIGKDAFALCPNVAFRCRKNSSAAAYAAEHGFDIF